MTNSLGVHYTEANSPKRLYEIERRQDGEHEQEPRDEFRRFAQQHLGQVFHWDG